jgi:hypothetical protein
MGKGVHKMKLIIAIAAIVLVASAAQAQRVCVGQQAQHCLVCAARYAIARHNAGDPRQLRLEREIGRRAGGNQASWGDLSKATQSLHNTRDYQSGLRAARRACGCPSWC